jgi:hypothetical protein
MDGIDNASIDFFLCARISIRGISSSDISSVIGVDISIGFIIDVDSLDLFDLRIVIFFERFVDCMESK